MRSKATTSRQIAKHIAGFAHDVKAQDIVVLDMRACVNFCDFFVIATGTSDRHVKSIVDGIDEGLAKMGIRAHQTKSLKGFGGAGSPDMPEGAWMLLDIGDVVVHVFEPSAREFYGLEHLWQDAPKVKI